MTTSNTAASAPVRDEIRKVINHIETLPAPPEVASRVLEKALEEEPDIAEISALIESDQSLTMKVLHLANSPVYGQRERVSSVEQATLVLGLSTLKNALLGVFIRDALLDDPAMGDPLLRSIWEHSLATAVASQAIAERCVPDVRGAAFAAGMIHDCGKLVLLTAMPERYEEILLRWEKAEGDCIDLEQNSLATNHTLVGKWLAQRWNLPHQLLHSAWLHHHPPEGLAAAGADAGIVAVVSLASRMAHEIMADNVTAGAAALRDAYMAHLGLDRKAYEIIKDRAAARYAERAALYDPADDSPPYFHALQRAGRKLSGLTVDLGIKNEMLSRTNRAVSALADAGRRLASARGTEEALDTAASVLSGGLGAPGGCVYLVDPENHILEGRVWRQANGGPVIPSMEILCQLDGRLTPSEDSLLSLPGYISPHIRSYRDRVPPETPGDGNGGSVPAFQKPFWILPLVSDGEFLGEMMVEARSGNSGKLLIHEPACLRQLAVILASTMGRLRLSQQLEERAERLGSAMRDMRQINMKLAQTERLAAVGHLAAGAAHEINNPLAIIHARAQLLELKEEDENKKKALQLMMGQIDRISTILTGLMDFARPSPPHFEEVSINRVLNKILDVAMSGREAKNFTVVRNLDPDLLPVQADAHQLEQVFLNLIINAQHAMEGRAGTLTVTSRMSGEHGIAVSVADEGSGIPQSILQDIFNPFFTTKEEGKGTGLGLSTSYGIVRSHKGDIAVTSRENEGSTFTVTLPLDQNVDLAPNAAVSKNLLMDSEAVLVVDDEAHIREILIEMLEQEGYRVEAAVDGQDALEMLDRESFRLMLLDIRMPRQGGLAVLAEAGRKAPDMPVIVITGLASPEERQEALTLGALKCVKKPFKIEELRREIRSALGNGGKQLAPL